MLQRIVRPLLAALSWMALCVLATAPAHAASAWLPPVDLSEEGQEVRFGPYVAMDGLGDALAVWSGYDGREETFRPAGGSWQPPGSLAGEGQEVEHPCMAMSSGGEALALWAAGNGKRELVIEAASKPAGGGWQAPVTVAEKLTPKALLMTECHVAIDPAGDAVAVWSYETEFEFQPVWAAYRPAGGAWEAPVELSPPRNPESAPDVAIDPHGDAEAVWIGRSFNIQAQYKPAGSDWREPTIDNEPETLSEHGHSASEPQVVFDSQGDAIAAWDIYAGEKHVVQAVSRTYGGAWQRPVDLSEAEQNAAAPAVAMDSGGNALAVWDLQSGENTIIQGASRPAGGEWKSPADLSAADEDAYRPQLAMDAEGDAIAAWELQSGPGWSVQSTVKPDDGEWQAPITVSEATAHGELFPQVAIDPDGDALAAWELYDGTSYLVQAAGYQAGGPQLQNLAIPSTGTVGEPVAFSVSPLDDWAALASTRWSFGDGGSATGTNVTHVYVAAGTYQVTLTSEDALGNMSSASGTVTIGPGPSTGPPGTGPTHPLGSLAPKPPRISGASMTRRRFHVGGKATAFRLMLSTVAKLQIAITRLVTGLHHGRRCLAPTRKLSRERANRCTRRVAAGTLTRLDEQAGADTIPFSGRIGRRALSPGDYQATLSASNTAGRSNLVTLTFTVVR